MEQTTAPPPEAPIAAAPTSPLIRPLAFPIQEGTLWTAGLTEAGQPTTDDLEWVWLRITPYGHWYTSENWLVSAWSHLTQCHSCGAVGEFTFELDARRCPRPATAQDVATALLASVPRPAPVVPAALYAGVSA